MSLRIALIAALVLSGLGGFLIYSYGKAKYKQGYSKARVEAATSNTRANNETIKLREEIQNETSNLSNAAIDRDLINLGIMRELSDR